MKVDWLALLSTVLPPPAEPLVGESTWEQVAEALGVRFPPAYKGLMDTYGSGLVGSSLSLVSPRALHFRAWSTPSREAIAGLGPEGSNSPLPPFPAPGASLLPVAGNGNGDDIFLVVTDGVADEERVWMGNIRNLDWLLVPGPISRLLHDVLTGGATSEAVVAVFGTSAWTLQPTFVAMVPTH